MRSVHSESLTNFSPGRFFSVKGSLLFLIFLVSLQWAQCQVTFPLQVSENKRYLVDQNGVPFFIQSDTPWSLFVALTKEEAGMYLENRHQKGFNTITVNLIEHWFNGDTTAYPIASINQEGEAPFTFYLPDHIPDFTHPNEKYFAHVDYILQEAMKKNILVMMTPAYMGYTGTTEGWYKEILANGPDRCRFYGRFLGNRYKDFPNIIWVMDGDRNPDSLSRPLELELINGIKESDKIHLFTAHCHPTNSSRDQWEGQSWLGLNAIYTYNPKAWVYEKCLDNYQRQPAMPEMLFECAYEGEHRITSADLRAEMYWGWLCCIAGQQIGNKYIWKFAKGWQASMESEGSWDEARLKKIVDSRNWYKLEPDYNHETVTEGYGKGDTYIAAARADDGETVVVYIPANGSEFSVKMNRVSGTTARAWWVNPRDGLVFFINNYPTEDTVSFTPPTADDWVLVIDDASKDFGEPGRR